MTNKRESASEGISAAELMAQLANDKEYQSQRAIFKRDLAERKAVWRAAEEPIVAELRAVGVELDSVWDLVNTDVPYPSALPVLIRYLEDGELPDRVLEGLGRALAVGPAIEFWDRLIALRLSPASAGQAEGSAVALAACVTPDRVDDLIRIVTEEERRPEHIFFLRPILKLGGDRGREVLASLDADPVLAVEAQALLSGG